MALKHIRILFYVSFAFILLEQFWCLDTIKVTCPEDHRCRERNMCRPSAMKLISGRPIICGISRRGREMVCCPQKKFSRGRPPITQPLTPEKDPNRTPDIKPVSPNPGDCGVAFGEACRGGLVIGGEKAEQGAWPWMVAVMEVHKRDVQSSVCTGYLIDRRHVLTAAQCFPGKQGSKCMYLKNEKNDAYCFKGTKYSTRIGHVNLTLGDEYTISRIVVHEDYRAGQYYNDIALLTLSKDVDVPNFNPICLPSSTFGNLNGRGTTVAGWGATIVDGPTSRIQMQLSAMSVVPNDLCDSIYRRNFKTFNRQFPDGIRSEMMCAGYLGEPRKDSCMSRVIAIGDVRILEGQPMELGNSSEQKGDSGGPLMMQKEDRWYAVGIVSFGFQCGNLNLPGGYTRVSKYVTWINLNKS